jgi:hypothetical protein
VISQAEDDLTFALFREFPAGNAGAAIPGGVVEQRVGGVSIYTTLVGNGGAEFTPAGIFSYDPERPAWDVGPPAAPAPTALPRLTVRKQKELTSTQPARWAAPFALHEMHSRYGDLLERHNLDPDLVRNPGSSRTISLPDHALVAVLYAVTTNLSRSRVRVRVLELLHKWPGQGPLKWSEDRLHHARAEAVALGFLDNEKLGNGPSRNGGTATPKACRALTAHDRALLVKRGWL